MYIEVWKRRMAAGHLGKYNSYKIFFNNLFLCLIHKCLHLVTDSKVDFWNIKADLLFATGNRDFYLKKKPGGPTGCI